MKSYIDGVQAKGIGLFDELNVKFNPRFNFIIGPNSSGKTTILKILALIFNAGQANQLRYTEESELWADLVYDSKHIRTGLGKGWATHGDEYQKAKFNSWGILPPDEQKKYRKFPDLDSEEIMICPLFLGAYRKISYKKIKGVEPEENPKDTRQKYKNNYQTSLNGNYLPNVKQWLINRYFQIDKNWAETEKANWIWILDNLHTISPENAVLRFIKIERDLEPIFEINGVQCYLEELSSGFQAILALIFEVVNWIEGTHEHQIDRLASSASGTVIIDELDAHLHPEWQFIVRDSLDKLFPNLQIIATTHSPHLIASAKEHEVIVLPEISRIVKVEPKSIQFSGWNTDDILTDLMGVKNIYTKDYNNLIKQALDYVDKNDSENLKNVIDKLKAVTNSNDTVVESLEIKYAELLLKKNDTL